MSVTVRVFRDPAAMVDAAAAFVVDAAAAAVASRGRFRIALSGGSTPRGLYLRLATNPAVRAALPWPQIDWWFGDERHVPPDHPDSNYRMAREALFSRAPIDPARVHRMPGEDPDAGRVADAYDRALRDAFDVVPPRFDLVLLGLGADGHTASLFPGSAALRERDRLVVSNAVPALATVRLTMTLPVLNAARQVMFLVAGDDKAPALARVLEDPGAGLPAQAVRPAGGAVVWLVDAAAARDLRLAT